MNTQSQGQQLSFLENLNPAQHAAVTAPLGVQMIVAGAGSGKTRVITSRIAYLLEHYRVPASAIVALTFTNRAGTEMKERIRKYLPGAALPFVGTFHSYCVKLLKQHSAHLPFADFTIMDTEDQRALLKRIMENYGIEKQITPAKMHGLISLSKNKLPGTNDLGFPPAPFFHEVAAAYEKEKNRSHSYDFDDLLLITLDLIKKNPAVRAFLQRTIRHLLVDEYQDTNQVQHELLKYIAFKEDGTLALESVCAVGDQDQSIYSWRGAQADNMQRFCKDFAPVQVSTIEQNYRSVKPILHAANGVIAHNRGRLEKKLWSLKEAENRLLSIFCQNGSQESHVVTQAIQLAKQKIALNNIAILYRTHNQSRLIEEAFMLAGLPYMIVGGTRFYERKEIKDILAYAKLLVNRFDQASFFRIMNTPTRGLGDKCIELVEQRANEFPELSYLAIVADIQQNPPADLKMGQRAAFADVHKLLAADYRSTAASALVENIINATDYHSYLRKNYSDQELTQRIENVQELLTAIRSFEQEHTGALLPEFLEHVMLMQEIETSDEPVQQIKLMTLHSAKGLEFDFVILCGLEEQLFPSARAMNSQSEMDEERRLMYVGLTRAREFVLLTHCEMRSTYGTPTFPERSRFLHEIPTELVAAHDTRQESPFARTRRLAEWLVVQPPVMAHTYGGFERGGLPRASSTRNDVTAGTQTHTKGQLSQPSWRATARPSSPLSRETKKPSTPFSPRAPWLVRMPVKHDVFGTGLIQAIEQKGGDEYFLTISFKSGIKKLSSKFVTRV